MSLNPTTLKIGYIILIASGKFPVEKLQRKAGYGESSKWTHVAGSLGGYDIIEAYFPRSHVTSLERYINRGCDIKVLRRKGQKDEQRYKVALWWATMNNLPYDLLQFIWFPAAIIFGKIGLWLHNLLSSKKRFICSELIAAGFYKEGDKLFNKPIQEVLPADFDNEELFEEVRDK